MTSASEATPWDVDTESRVLGLEVILLKKIYILPWTQFLYAEGGPNQLRAVFTTHDVLVEGSGLDALLSDFAAQQVCRLREPARTDKFTPGSGPRITALAVRKPEAESQ